MATDPLLEALNGGTGSLLSKLVTFPLDLVKTRSASSALTPLQVALSTLEKQGPLGFYQGIGPKLFKSVTGKVLYFFNYSVLSNLARDADGNVSPIRNLVVGYWAEIFELPVIMPLEAVATRTQLSKQSGIDAFRALLSEGKLFVSLDAYIIGACQPALQNTIFDQLRALFKRDLSSIESFFLGVIASSFAITATYPLDFARTIAQGRSKKDGDQDDSLVAILTRTIKSHGVLGIFKGLTPSLMQGVLSASLMLMIKAKIADFNRKLVYGVVAKSLD